MPQYPGIFAAAAAGVPQCPAGLATGLVGYWKLDETSGTTASDSSGNGNSFSLVNFAVPASWVDGLLNGALDFDIANLDHLVSDTTFFDPNAGAFTLAGWVWMRSHGGVEKVIFHQNDGTGTGRTNLSVAASQSINTFIGGSGMQGVTTVTTGAWHHVAVTAASGGSGTISLYLDGALENSATKDPEAATGTVLIGVHKAGDRHWDGLMDDLRVYNRELTAAEVSDLYNAGSGCVS